MAGRRRGPSFLTEEEKKNRPKVSRELIERILGYLKPYKLQMAFIILCIFLSSLFRIWPTILMGRIIDEGLIARDLPVLIKLILLTLGVTLVANLIGVLESYLTTWIGQHITFDMRNAMYKHLQRMPYQFFQSNHQGDIVTRMTSDIGGVQQVIASTLTNIISNAITLIIALVAMFQRNWILALVGMAIVPLFVLPTKKVGQTRWMITNEAQEKQDEINSILNETLSVSGQLLVKLFTKEVEEYEKYENINSEMVKLNIKESMAGRWFRVVLSTITSVGPMLIYLVGGILMIRYGSDLSVGDITVMVSLLNRMYGPVNQLMNIQVDWIRSMALFTRIFEYFDMPVEIKSKKGAKTLETSSGEVEFRNVSFSYDEKKQILKDVSFKLEQGKSIAIVGPSGSGKSTITNLIPRLYDVDEGAVLYDGVDVRDLDLESLRDQIGIVTQDTYLFNGTIRDNLLYARPEATDEEIYEAAKKANIYDFIMNAPDGLDTEVGNRGLKLSGGEKQRLSIARILLKNPHLLIFDEATASLDSISEQLIQQAINELLGSRTSIMIAHRLSTILMADEILVVKAGEIVERGTHEELLQVGGVYKELYDTQFNVFEKETNPPNLVPNEV